MTRLWPPPKYTINYGMNSRIVQSTGTVTLLGAAPVTDAILAESLALAPVLVAADGAARRALAAGILPEAVIGDMDSLDDATRAAIPADRLWRVSEQEHTDFDKALHRIAAPLVLAVGFTGQRLDHELAVYNALVRHPERAVIVVGEEDICCHCPPEILLLLDPGTRVSLFPMASVCVRAEGLKWPLDDLLLAPWGRVGTSNESIAQQVVVRPDGAGLLLILPRTALRPLMQALADGSVGVRGR